MVNLVEAPTKFAEALKPSRFVSNCCYILLFTIISVVSNPYHFDEPHSRRYLLPVIKATDPALFENDDVLISISKFRSLCYDALSGVVSVLGVSAGALEVGLKVLYGLLLLCNTLVIFGIARLFDKGIWPFILLAMWCSQPRGSMLGGDGLFSPSFTHRELAVCLGLLAIYFILQDRYSAGGLTLALIVFIHALIAFHLFLVTVPAILFLRRRIRWQEIVALVPFLASSAFYVVFFSPISMSMEATQILLEAKGRINHISLFGQSPLQWLATAGMIALAFLAHRILGETDGKVSLVKGFILSGAFSALLISALVALTGSGKLAQFQPMRVFTWVTFFVYLLVIVAASKALTHHPTLAAALLAVLSFGMLGAAPGLAFLALGILYLLLQYRPVNAWLPRLRPELLARGGIVFLTVGVFAALAAGKAAPFQSLRDPFTSLLALCALALTFVPVVQFRTRSAMIMLMMALALYGRARSRGKGPGQQVDGDWHSVSRWCRANTAKTHRFLTPPDTGGFRFYSLRTPVAEVMSSLAWVDPFLYKSQKDQEARVRKAYSTPQCDLAYLFALAREWKAQYVVSREPCEPVASPVFRANQYAVYRVD